jgi:hypothetical protein
MRSLDSMGDNCVDLVEAVSFYKCGRRFRVAFGFLIREPKFQKPGFRFRGNDGI